MFNVLLDNLMFNWFTIPVWDADWQMYEDKTLFRIITRSISNSVLFFIIFIREIFLGGFQTVNSLLGDGITDTYTWISIPALPWTAVVIGAVMIGYKLQGIRLALLAGIGFFLCFCFWSMGTFNANFIFSFIYSTCMFYNRFIIRCLGVLK
jgi:hypothetical protein